MTRPDPHASYREHVSSEAEAVEEDSSPALLPCPFCGGPAEYFASKEGVFSARWIAHVVHCLDCQGRVQTSGGKDDAIHYWNCRTDTTEIESLRAQLATAYERCAKIADPWLGFNVGQKISEPDLSVIEVRTKIAAAIRALNSGGQK